jgi:hypothetical protein
VREATCADLEAALAGEDAELAEVFSRHARSCAACGEELALAEAITAAAPSLRKEWPSPGLDQRIRAGLRAEGDRKRRLTIASWATLAAAAGLTIALVARALFVPPAPTAPAAEQLSIPAIDDGRERLLTEQAAAEVDKAEQAYVRSIDSLSKLAEPRLTQSRSELVANYREKLLLIDSAIAECHSQIDRNRFYAHLRLELLSLYREKQRTLDSLLKEDPNAL